MPTTRDIIQHTLKLNELAGKALDDCNIAGLNITPFILPADLSGYQARAEFGRGLTMSYTTIKLPIGVTDEAATTAIQAAIQRITRKERPNG